MKKLILLAALLCAFSVNAADAPKTVAFPVKIESVPDPKIADLTAQVEALTKANTDLSKKNEEILRAFKIVKAQRDQYLSQISDIQANDLMAQNAPKTPVAPVK